MKSGRFPVERCLGAIALHRLQVEGRIIAKGARLTKTDIAALEAAGINTILAAFPGGRDMTEEQAAKGFGRLLASAALKADPPVNGRVNLRSRKDGLLVIDGEKLARLNLIHEGLGISTLPSFTPVRRGQLAATIKIVPFALPATALQKGKSIAGGKSPLAVHAFRHTAGVLVLTETGASRKLSDKTVRAVAARLEALGGRLARTLTLPHEEQAVAAALKSIRPGRQTIVLLMGASATSDHNDVLPKALRLAGGKVERYGIPVDPGNLLFTGKHKGAPVIGLPGCARSQALNGVDWILERTAAGIALSNKDFARLGLGGLLKEASGRPSPREPLRKPSSQLKVAGLVLASGEGRRFKGGNKLLAKLDGKTVIEGTVRSLHDAGLSPISVVVGHEQEKIRAALAGLGVEFVENPDYAEGMAAAICRGIRHLEGKTEAAVIALGDMPLVKPGTIKALIAALDPASGQLIAIPAWRGKRGNPVAWHKDLFARLARLEGDTGGKAIIAELAGTVVEVAVDDPGILSDFDTREALDAAAKGE